MSETWVKRVQDQMPDLIVSGLALYFAAVFGYAGIKALIGLQYGYIDAASITVAQSIINTFDLAPSQLTTLAAAIGALKLAIAGFFLLAATERSPSGSHGQPLTDHEALDLALHGGLALTLLLTLPSWASGDTAVLRTDIANLILMAVAAGTSRYERRSHRRRTATLRGQLEEHGVVASEADAPPV